MMHFGRFRILAAGAALAAVMAANPALSATPADTLVQAWAIDDIITLDPAESFEISPAEVLGNAYDRLIQLDISDTSKVIPGAAESWTVSDDGLTYTFKLRKDAKFASGNPLTAADVAYTFERGVRLDKAPAFILTQFGLTGENVTEKAKAVDETTFVLTVDKPYAPSFVLNCLTATVGSIVDKKLLEEHAAKVTPSDDYKYDTDYGNAWLKTGYAGSGPFKIRDWRANEVVVLERNDNFYGEKAKLARVFYRHVKESATQRLMLESGDVDVARNLEPGDYEAVQKNEKLQTVNAPKGTVYYISLNQKNAELAKPEVREAFKYLVDYDAIGATLIKGIGEVRQTYQAKGVLGSLDANPYKLDIDKAKELLAKAGLKDGLSITFDVRNTQPVTGIAESFQQSAAKAGINISIVPGDGKQTLTKYRARNHDLYIGQWGMDYWDPNSNAEAFTSNPDNGDDASNKTLAWRNAWAIPELTQQTQAALLERDGDKRAEQYKKLQQEALDQSPFVMLFQQVEVAGIAGNVKGYKLGPTFDSNYLAPVSKD
ncbi:ABC transporter substrate-binding protein [Ochrobactrum quorumnocens]|jgi:peptide/nickel transport system substrate-binding protein|uniref:ABC transporter substrate-binding protein n=2 Tax=Ochrobactrum quorumnocens TaxID=271865 RepID=A0A5N1JU34_9HYPH|nr:ABC transporter substrate-binding protein [[Ochrobactrum] quorumnocens]KAA9367667.1 ABC transporter substrate-binding protein [[Ochrobactrum] quorumnocens]MBD7989973.1 ABC transporter substrate-binding protein [Ochrobactrum gallinarum]